MKQGLDKEAELLVLLEKTPIDLWNADLDRFLDEWFVSGSFYFLRSSPIDSNIENQ